MFLCYTSQTDGVFLSSYDIEDSFNSKTYNRFVEMLDMGSFINQSVRPLSFGQRMRTDIVAALLHSPQIVFLTNRL